MQRIGEIAPPLVIGYGLLKIGGINGTGLLAYAVVLSFTPILFAALRSRLIMPELLRPDPALQAIV
ncbi:hypothetical protein ACV229_09605 [Burkholderia sp. MR1-5-21]